MGPISKSAPNWSQLESLQERPGPGACGAPTLPERGEPGEHLAEAGGPGPLEEPLKETTECHLNMERKEAGCLNKLVKDSTL